MESDRMTPEEVILRSENGISLFSASTEDLITARKFATRSIQLIEIDREIHNRKSKRAASSVSGITNVMRKNRCPTKRDLR